MSSVLDRLKKKRGSPVEIDGETYHVRSLTIGELKRLGVLDGEQKTGFVIGCALVNEDGSPVMQKPDSSSDKDWSIEVLKNLEDVPTQTIKALSDGIANLGKNVKPETVIKN